MTLEEPEASEPLSLIVCNDYSIDQAHRPIGNTPSIGRMLLGSVHIDRISHMRYSAKNRFVNVILK